MASKGSDSETAKEPEIQRMVDRHRKWPGKQEAATHEREEKERDDVDGALQVLQSGEDGIIVDDDSFNELVDMGLARDLVVALGYRHQGYEVMEDFLWEEGVVQTSKVELQDASNGVHVVVILLPCQRVLTYIWTNSLRLPPASPGQSVWTSRRSARQIASALLTFSFIFSIFLTLERRTGFSSVLMLARVSGERGVCRSSCRLERPICFSSCFSASFSLDSALMLSVLYMWYVFITWEQGQTQFCFTRSPAGPAAAAPSAHTADPDTLAAPPAGHGSLSGPFYSKARCKTLVMTYAEIRIKKTVCGKT
ncbi:hypothetical protein EYF80_026478 [Liparis tanakae]|uniref:Uncharacterized protein n=1 Tax=Liparis tanakae TaxID=230148 RepID=A0A4Z2HEU4_9TELE|nr:hypothetical protein EYF80_026478 [Liparis tanakae]